MNLAYTYNYIHLTVQFMLYITLCRLPMEGSHEHGLPPDVLQLPDGHAMAFTITLWSYVQYVNVLVLQ
jgi:hypothetical protein